MNEKLQSFLKANKVFDNKKANKFGISNRIITYYKNKGILEQYSKGIYISNYKDSPELDPVIEGLVAILFKIPYGIISRLTALYLYEMTDEIPKEFWITIPHEKWKPKIINTRIIRSREHNEGKTIITLSSVTLPIYNRERTLIECFKYLDLETAIKALKIYLNGKDTFKPDIGKLEYYSRKFKKNISNYIVSLSTR